MEKSISSLPSIAYSSDSAPPPVFARNLLNDLRGLALFYRQELSRGSWMNTYLLSAGINQIVEDYLHLDPFYLHKAAKVIARDAPAPLRPFSWIVRAAASVASFAFSRQPHVRRLRRWQADWASLVQDLAGACMRQPQPASEANDGTERFNIRSAALLAELDHFPAQLLHLVLHLPACFRGFDQTPDDYKRMVHKFSDEWPDRGRRLVLVGIRTSGSYLAPLCLEFLHDLGYQDVSVITLRPKLGWLPAEKEYLQSAVRENALFIVVDDPPASGGTYLKSAQALQSARVPHDAIILFMPLFRNSVGFPKFLESYAAVVLPWEEWQIHQKLDPHAVRAALSALLEPGIQITDLKRLPTLPDTVERGHMRALYRTRLLDSETGREYEEDIFAKGVGFAYFGEHTLAVTPELSVHLPYMYGLRDGLLYREWLAEEQRLPDHLMVVNGQETAAAAAIVGYILQRRRMVAVPQDLSLRLFSEEPAWEVASNVVSQVFGRAWWIARVPLVDPLVRRLLYTPHPSIIDGNMSPSNWFVDGNSGHLIKIAFDEGVFHNDIEFTSYDPVFDLASLAADLDLASLGGAEWARRLLERLRPLYQAESGEMIDEERWMIYHLIRLWDLQREQSGIQYIRIQRAFSRALERYYAATYFQGIASPSSGPICALDVDGVLESNYLGFAALSPASANTLRALVLHGYRPLMATGRSLPEVIERCALYPFSGAVAEYGAVTYLSATGRVNNLLTEDDQAVLSDLRAALRAMPGIQLDPDYAYAVRAFRCSQYGHPLGLTPAEIAAALEKLGRSGLVRAIPGESQTDFIVAGIDKRSGLRALLKELQPNLPSDVKLPLALAVGDTLSDLPMLELAKLACVPAHANVPTAHTPIKRMRKPYQAGLALAAGQLLGHAPGKCPQCITPRLSPDTRHLLTLFSAQEAGTGSMLRSAIRLALAGGRTVKEQVP